MAAGQQLDFEIRAEVNGDYLFRTFGFSDTVPVLFQEMDGELRFVDGDDDSGAELNARFRARLRNDQRYVLRLRLYFAQDEGGCGVVWH
ncbi:MAG: hypothetical protein MI723_07250 [Caulobacterales bacterium]|nr:hypothetical protein [Caulobacterales bacterium]